MNVCYSLSRLTHGRGSWDTAYSVSVWTWNHMVDYGAIPDTGISKRWRSKLGVEARRKGTPFEDETKAAVARVSIGNLSEVSGIGNIAILQE